MYIHTSKQKLRSCCKKNWDLFFDRCNEELLTISVTMTCEDDLCACPRSMQCKCSLYCMHADLCVCEFDFNLMWTFWITACGLDICLFLLRMFNAIFAQHVAVQFLLHIYTYMCVCWDKSLIEWVRKSVLVPVLKTVLAVAPFYTTAQQMWKKVGTQAHVTEFQFRMQILNVLTNCVISTHKANMFLIR